MAQIIQSPYPRYVLIGTSDAGAHVLFGANFGYATTLLGLWVRERNVLSLERAVHKLTFEVASVYGIEDGRLTGELPGQVLCSSAYRPGA